MRKLYSKLHGDCSEEILNGQIPVSTTFRRYKNIFKHGKRINSSSPNGNKSYVLASPVFQFTSSRPSEFDGELRPAELHYFLEHSITIPNSSKPFTHNLAHVSWPMVHPQRSALGKPVEIWCNGLDEPTSINSFIPVTAIAHHVVYSVDRVNEENVLVVIPVIE